MFHITSASLLSVCLFASSVVWTAPSPIQKRDVDQATFDNLKFFSQFSAAAYCTANNDKGTDAAKVTCPGAGNCPLVEADNVTSIVQFQNSLFTDVTGYAAIDYTKQLIVLAFRGSHTLRNYIADVDIVLTDTDICDKCRATKGFYGSWVEARKKVLPPLKAAIAANPSYQVIVTGHSLGGAIATIAAAELRNDNGAVDLYTYGSPRVSDNDLVDYMNAQSTSQGKGKQFRVTHKDDPVPRLPPYTLGFRHIDPELFIEVGNGASVSTADVEQIIVAQVGNGGGDDGPVNVFKPDIDAHLDYFGGISKCDNYDYFR